MLELENSTPQIETPSALTAIPTPHFKRQLSKAPAEIQKAFRKQVAFLLHDLRHPSLHAKKYDEGANRWQARVTLDWRFYFRIDGDIYYLLEITPHPK